MVDEIKNKITSFDYKEYKKGYYQKNKEKIKERSKDYYQRNKGGKIKAYYNHPKTKERIKKYKEEYKQRPKVKEKIKKYHYNYNKGWILRNSSKNREYKRKWDKKNKLLRKINAKKYRLNFPEKILAHRIAKKIPLNEYCELCSSRHKLERHHWRYDKPELINTLCNYCHNIQHNKFIIMGS